MPEKISEPKLPRNLSRLAFRFPICLFHAHLGWIMGHRFLLLTHTGRKSGLPRQNILEIVRFDNKTNACIVASACGEKSDWFLNITTNPKIVYQVQNRCFVGISKRLASEEGAQVLYDYAHHYPQAFRVLAHFMGYQVNGSEEDIRAVGRALPMFLFKPIREQN